MIPAEIPIPSFAPPKKWISGIHNCHVPGLNSYVIRGRADEKVGMVRAFHNEGDHRGDNFLGKLLQDKPEECRQEYMLLPHNHRQAIRIIPVRGSVVNVTFDLDRRSHDHM